MIDLLTFVPAATPYRRRHLRPDLINTQTPAAFLAVRRRALVPFLSEPPYRRRRDAGVRPNRRGNDLDNILIEILHQEISSGGLQGGRSALIERTPLASN